MTPEAAARAYWYRWRTSSGFKGGVLAVGLAPSIIGFAFLAAAFPDHRRIALGVALIVEILSPFLFAALVQQLSKRGTRVLMIDADGLTTEVSSGRWQAGWSDVRKIAETDEFIFVLGGGIHSVSIPLSAFADEAERNEFLRRARRYLADAHRSDS